MEAWAGYSNCEGLEAECLVSMVPATYVYCGNECRNLPLLTFSTFASGWTAGEFNGHLPADTSRFPWTGRHWIVVLQENLPGDIHGILFCNDEIEHNHVFGWSGRLSASRIQAGCRFLSFLPFVLPQWSSKMRTPYIPCKSVRFCPSIYSADPLFKNFRIAGTIAGAVEAWVRLVIIFTPRWIRLE
jgi:hypothetical protein